VQARSHLEALALVHRLREVRVWSPNAERRHAFVAESVAAASHGNTPPSYHIIAADSPEEAVDRADVIALVTSSTTPVIEDTWVKPGAHVVAIGACRPTHREIPPALTARARLFVDSRAAALVESGDVVIGIQEGRFEADHIVAELGELVNGTAGRRTASEITIFKSLGLAVEDVTAADLAWRRAVAHGVGRELTL
jgi:ornithine cyclodeaminase